LGRSWYLDASIHIRRRVEREAPRSKGRGGKGEQKHLFSFGPRKDGPGQDPGLTRPLPACWVLWRRKSRVEVRNGKTEKGGKKLEARGGARWGFQIGTCTGMAKRSKMGPDRKEKNPIFRRNRGRKRRLKSGPKELHGAAKQQEQLWWSKRQSLQLRREKRSEDHGVLSYEGN